MIETTKIFNKIDFINNYWQINIIEKNRHKTTFNTKRNKDEFCVMLFKFVNASTIFQTIINDILQLFLNKFVMIYLNNILIYSKNDEKYFEHVKFVIDVFEKHNYYAKSSKYFFKKQIEFCEHIVNNDKIRINEIKLKTIQN